MPMILAKKFDDKMIDKINKALDIELYDWQIAYLRGNDDAIVGKGTAAGKTYVQLIKIFMVGDDYIYYANPIDAMFGDGDSIACALTLKDEQIYTKEYIYKKRRKTLKLYNEVINKRLKAAGIKTREVIF